MTTKTIFVGAALIALAACGEDKNYGDPLGDPGAPVHANGAVSNSQMLSTDTTNDTALNALNGVSTNMNVLTGIKLQAEQPSNQSLNGTSSVDEACVEQTETSITYNDCEYGQTTVNGYVSRSGADISIDVTFLSVSQDSTQDTRARGELTVDDTQIVGYLDFDIDFDFDNGSVHTDLDGDFDIQLAEGCAVGGELEVHGYASAYGQSQSVWVKAEYGPACGDVVVR